LQHRAVQEGELQEKAVARRRFDRTKERKIVKALPDGGHRLDTVCGNPPADDGLQAETGCVRREDLHGEVLAIPRELLGELGGQGGGAWGHDLRTFVSWDGRGRFGLARSSPRTNA